MKSENTIIFRKNGANTEIIEIIEPEVYSIDDFENSHTLGSGGTSTDPSSGGGSNSNTEKKEFKESHKFDIIDEPVLEDPIILDEPLSEPKHPIVEDEDTKLDEEETLEEFKQQVEEPNKNPSGDNENPSGDNENPSGDNENPSGDNENPSGDNGNSDTGEEAPLITPDPLEDDKEDTPPPANSGTGAETGTGVAAPFDGVIRWFPELNVTLNQESKNVFIINLAKTIYSSREFTQVPNSFSEALSCIKYAEDFYAAAIKKGYLK